MTERAIIMETAGHKAWANIVVDADDQEVAAIDRLQRTLGELPGEVVKVRALVSQQLARTPAVFGLDDLVSCPRQMEGDHFANGRLVFDYQDLVRCHGICCLALERVCVGRRQNVGITAALVYSSVNAVAAPI